MYGVLLQKLIGLTGTLANQIVVQGEEGWLDVSSYQDAMLWIEAKAIYVPAGMTLNLIVETAPVKDEASFLPLYNPAASAFPPVGTTVMLARAANASASYPPISNWLRWKIITTGSPGGGFWALTFRIWVSLNAVGSKGKALRASMSRTPGLSMLGNRSMRAPSPPGVPSKALTPVIAAQRSMSGTPRSPFR
jgi:hypothetical protein